MKGVITKAMKQDFSSHAVLGRVLFGVAFLVLGIYSILNAKMLANNAPGYVPEILAPVLVVFVGCIFAAGGAGIATGKAIARGATGIAVVWGLIALFTNAFTMHFDVREFFLAMAIVGAALVIKSLVDAPMPFAQNEGLKNSEHPPGDMHEHMHSDEG